ncbi:MAG TPA: anthranilate synthase component I family protein [Thermodesulfobacteriota bacterium]|nr:anthranilate synthase component I family protein [Thermodesulfobacteriota bacterium]HNU72498.1 anthranilate synthase component I family protein [Thermodesulfobacteriota bacterium]
MIVNLSGILPKIRSFRTCALPKKADPEIVFSHFHQEPYSVLLCGRGNPDNSRFAYLGTNPFLRIRHTMNHAELWVDRTVTSMTIDPFHLFREALNHYSVRTQPFPLNHWGAIGYFSYDAARYIERLPVTTHDDLCLPIMEMVYHRNLLIFDYCRQEVHLIQVDVGDGFRDPCEILERLDSGLAPLQTYSAGQEPVSCCTKEEYTDLVQKIIAYIKKGDAYEVNLSQRFQARYYGNEYAIFLKLYEINPAPFSAYLNFGGTIILSSSPERFLKVEDALVETRPIKGTISRSNDPEEDLKNRFLLLGSKKDDAELAMIVDLLRNDLGKVCEYGSVKVREHRRIEGFPNVWHLLSIVEGTLRDGEDIASLIRACFPGGSITGCPKIRSMEIIDELESYARNLYTGIIFVANDRFLDSSIVIRTMIAHNGTVYFSVGGAVVYESIPEREYEETLVKAQSILRVLQ